MPAHAGHERMETLADYYGAAPPSPDAPVERRSRSIAQLTFDKLTNVHYSGTRHAKTSRRT